MPKKTARRGSRKTAKRNVRRKSKSSRRKSKSKSKAKKVSKIIASSYGLAAMMKENEKGYKAQRVAKKDPYKVKYPPIPSNIKGKKKKKSSSKAAKDSFLAGIDSKPSKGNWIDHVKNVWKEGKKGNPNYKYKDAMKDAKKTW